LFTPFFNQFLDGYLLPQEHKGVITTIYKGKGDPLEITKRGPIILLNIDYKLLSKVLNSRLLRFLPQVVAANYIRFIPCRFLIDNVVTLGEIFEFSAPPQTFPAPIITFLDLEKAFDSIAHSTIARTLRHIRASESFSRLILDVLWGTSRINVNGHLSP
jgi:hypothetical protein